MTIVAQCVISVTPAVPISSKTPCNTPSYSWYSLCSLKTFDRRAAPNWGVWCKAEPVPSALINETSVGRLNGGPPCGLTAAPLYSRRSVFSFHSTKVRSRVLLTLRPSFFLLSSQGPQQRGRETMAKRVKPLILFVALLANSL